MIETLVVGGVILSVLVVGNLLLTLALVGRLRALQEMIANQVVLRDPALPQKGEPVGSFEATTLEGEAFTDAVLREGKTLVGFFTTGCRPCSSLRKQLVDSPPGMPLMAFVEGDPDDPQTLELGASLKQVARVAFLTEGDSVTRAIKQAGYPTLVLVERGVVAASGHHLHEVLP
ncbi:TlpA family protein disulfide reductase [Corallococcus macrosporus]|uniref:Thioredoxin domain-containing protein n=1 Tax=Myxococcus fulvus (strain ATCC BAA-855 / HW-1) TaxID=483219 RepID=F8C779_MYXFH|nr:hypothetical protein [Corallococcus macrosporus]AEI61955.1 hypothetical protein LILAB_00095 [Corallococcus macrosporus]